MGTYNSYDGYGFASYDVDCECCDKKCEEDRAAAAAAVATVVGGYFIILCCAYVCGPICFLIPVVYALICVCKTCSKGNDEEQEVNTAHRRMIQKRDEAEMVVKNAMGGM